MTSSLLFSRKVKEIEYEPTTRVLTIVSITGLIKRYYGVPETVYYKLYNAVDTNRVYQDIIDGHYSVA